MLVVIALFSGKSKEVSPTSNVPNHLRKLKAKPVIVEMVRKLWFLSSGDKLDLK